MTEAEVPVVPEVGYKRRQSLVPKMDYQRRQSLVPGGVPKMDYRRRQSLTMNALYGDITAAAAAAANIDAATAARGRRVSFSGINGLNDLRRGRVMSGGSAGIARAEFVTLTGNK